ncbi:MAG: YetF domain-containing protein [Clostridiaceae bacterium]
MPLNISIRVVVSLTLLFATTKFLTKISLSKLTYFDYVAGATLGTVAGNLTFNVNISILNYVLSITFISLIISFISRLTLKNKALRKFFSGEPTILIEGGKILEENLDNLNYCHDYLRQQLRQKEIFDINEVETAMLEANGELSIKIKDKPLTVEDYSNSKKSEGFAVELILNGAILEENLSSNGLDKNWLYEQLKNNDVMDEKIVDFAALSTNGAVYIIKKE